MPSSKLSPLLAVKAIWRAEPHQSHLTLDANKEVVHLVSVSKTEVWSLKWEENRRLHWLPSQAQQATHEERCVAFGR